MQMDVEYFSVNIYSWLGKNGQLFSKPYRVYIPIVFRQTQRNNCKDTTRHFCVCGCFKHTIVSVEKKKKKKCKIQNEIISGWKL